LKRVIACDVPTHGEQATNDDVAQGMDEKNSWQSVEDNAMKMAKAQRI
jgi:hypothetical protein